MITDIVLTPVVIAFVISVTVIVIIVGVVDYLRNRRGRKYSDYITRLSPIDYWKLDETSGDVCKDSVGGHDGTYEDDHRLDALRYSMGVDENGVVYIGGKCSGNTPDNIAIWTGSAWSELDRAVKASNDYKQPDMLISDQNTICGFPVATLEYPSVWRCEYCGQSNYPVDLDCRKCGAPRRKL